MLVFLWFLLLLLVLLVFWEAPRPLPTPPGGRAGQAPRANLLVFVGFVGLGCIFVGFSLVFVGFVGFVGFCYPLVRRKPVPGHAY